MPLIYDRICVMGKNLKNQVGKINKKTFIDPKLLKYTREFKDKEIKEWEKEDALYYFVV